MNKLILKEPKLTLYEASVGDTSYSQEYSSSADKEEVANKFLDAFEKHYNLKLNLNLRQAIVKHIDSLGGGAALNYLQNPYLQFLVNYNKAGLDVSQFNAVDYDNLIHLYGDEIISQDNMFATGQRGKEDILFVESLWKNSYEEIKYLCQAFYWLNNKTNFNTLNLSKLTNDNKLEFLSYLGMSKGDNGQYIPQDSLTVADKGSDFILFVNGVYSHKGELRKANNISKAMDYLDTIRSDLGVKNDFKTELDDIKQRQVKDPTKWIEKGIDTKHMNIDDAKELMKYIATTFNIKI
jgi:hypothetical protein